LLYVATTRAADHLVLSSGIEKPKEDDENSSGKEKEFAPKGEWLQLLVRRFGLAKDMPIEEGDLIKVVSAKPELPSKIKACSTRVPLEEIEVKTRAMAEAGEGSIPPHLAPIAPDPSTRRQMSFSRLSGKLHRMNVSPLPLGEGLGVRASSLNEDLGDLTETASRIDPLSLGTLVHAVLAEIDFAAPNNLAALLARHAPMHVGDDRTAVESAQRMLEDFLSSPRAKEIAKADCVYRELEFLLSWPSDGNDPASRYFQGFIDLLYRDAGGWHLLDFKTNEVADKNLDAVAANYELQMLVYALAIEKIFGQPPEELTLHFLRTGRDYPFSWNDESRRRVMQLVDQSLSAGD
jgi:ATP-dependent exoDNAse (exonuclease V) beta subunit